jgi:hypothetical protein
MTPPTPRTASAPHLIRPRTDDTPPVDLDDEVDTDAAAEPDTAGPRPPTGTDTPELTERERSILDFERQWWRHAGAKEQAIRDQFALSSTRYYQTVNALLDNPAALAYDPVLVRRLRRLRATRARARSGARRSA